MTKSRRLATNPLHPISSNLNSNVNLFGNAPQTSLDVNNINTASSPFNHRKLSRACQLLPTSIATTQLRHPSLLLILFIAFVLTLTLISTQTSFFSCPSLDPTLISRQSQRKSNTTETLNDVDDEIENNYDNNLNKNQKLINTLEKWKDKEYARKRLKIYVYNLPTRYNIDLVRTSHLSPSAIRDPYCDENFYSSEVHVHQFLLNSNVRVLNASEADFFYVPVYITCDLINTHPISLKRTGKNFKSAMNYIIDYYPYWNQSQGRDHIFLFSQGFAARLAGDWTFIKNSIFMVHNGEMTALEYNTHKDFTIPPELRAYFQPIWLSPSSKSSNFSSSSNSLTSNSIKSLTIKNNHVQINNNNFNEDLVFSKNKKYLGQFGGQVVNSMVSDSRGSNYSGGVRQFISTFLTDDPEYRITGIRSTTYLQDMLDSKFCLAPEGWHPWTPRPYYALQMGCIPVIISQVQEMAFEEFVDWDQFTVWIRPKDIKDMDAILRTISEEELNRRRLAMKQIWRVFWYHGEHGLGYQAILQALYNRKLKHSPRRSFTNIHNLHQNHPQPISERSSSRTSSHSSSSRSSPDYHIRH